MFGIPVTRLIIIGIAGVAAYAYVSNGGKPLNLTSASQSTNQCSFTVHADLLNVRGGPGTDHSIVGHYRQDDVVNADKAMQNGFRRIDDTHWVSNDFLVPQSNTC